MRIESDHPALHKREPTCEMVQVVKPCQTWALRQRFSAKNQGKHGLNHSYCAVTNPFIPIRQTELKLDGTAVRAQIKGMAWLTGTR
jgi:hypothetical protein